MKLLLATAIDKDHVNNLGWTALLEAVILGDGGAAHTEIVRLLVAAGANVNIADRDRVTPLAHAKRRGYREMVRILSAAGGALRLTPRQSCCGKAGAPGCAVAIAGENRSRLSWRSWRYAVARDWFALGEQREISWFGGLWRLLRDGRGRTGGRAVAAVQRGDYLVNTIMTCAQLPHAEGAAGRDRRQGLLRRSVASTNRRSR